MTELDITGGNTVAEYQWGIQVRNAGQIVPMVMLTGLDRKVYTETTAREDVPRLDALWDEVSLVRRPSNAWEVVTDGECVIVRTTELADGTLVHLWNDQHVTWEEPIE